jgi:formamidopyrimidine-DNA glycosylase
MDQTLLAGIGNIYAQEALFCAKIHPERRADTLTARELKELHACLVAILKSAITKKGSTTKTFRQIDGEGGEYFSSVKVYQRAWQPCQRCAAIIQRKTIGGRGTYFCYACQK